MLNLLHKNNVFLLIALLFTATACEEVIEIDLNSTNPLIVVEGVIEKDSPAWIQLSYTSDYFTPEEAVMINNAKITITSNTGESEILTYIGEGNYKGVELLGIEKQRYDISIQFDDEFYTASTNIYAASEILDVEIEENSMQRPGHDASYSASITFKDEIGLNNFYMLKYIINGELQTVRYSLVDDSFYNDKGSIEFTPMMLNLELNDVVEVLLYSIDEDTYVYYSQLNDQGGNMMNSSTPYNPKSNFGINVLGYFTGWSVVSYEFTVTE